MHATEGEGGRRHVDVVVRDEGLRAPALPPRRFGASPVTLVDGLARVEVTTLGRFEVRIAGIDGTRIATAAPSLELFKFLLCRPELRASPAEIKLALWPADEIGVDRASAARIRDGNFASARARLEHWFADNGAADVARLDERTYALDRSRCIVDALEADAAFARIARGDVDARAALAAFELYDKPFLPGDFEARRGKRYVLPAILSRREQLLERSLRAYAVALRRARANPHDAAEALALAERARRTLETSDGATSRDARASLAAVLDEGTPNRPRESARARRGSSTGEAAVAPADAAPIGRAAESDELFARLSAANHGRVIVVEGPAGVGATSLVRAVAARVAASGARVVVDLDAAADHDDPNAPRGSGTNSLDLPTRAVEHAIAALGPDLAVPALLPAAPDLVRVIPSLAAWFSSPSRAGARAAPLDPARRAALLASAVRLLDAVRPALIVLDRLDLENRAANAFAAEILHQIGRFRDAVRYAVVLTARPGDDRARRSSAVDAEASPVDEVSPRALPLDGAERIRLGPLSPEDARKLAAQSVDVPSDAAALTELAARGDGLPANILALARSGGRVGPEFAARRLRATPEDERMLLAAFARAPLPIGLSAAVTAAGGRPGDDRWFDALEALLDADLLAERDGGYVVRETLLGESLRAEAEA